MNENTATTFARSGVGAASSAGPKRPSSVGIPVPSSAEYVPYLYAADKPQTADCSGADVEDASGIDAILSDAKREMHKKNQSAALRTIRSGADEFEGCGSDSISRMLLALGDTLGDIAPFSNECPPSQPLSRYDAADLGGAELDPRKWGRCEGGTGLEEVPADLDAVLDPRKWGRCENSTGLEEVPADLGAVLDPKEWGLGEKWESHGGLTGNCGTLVNPTLIAMRYEREAEDARNGDWHHELNDIPIFRYNEMIRASNDVAKLWERKVEATAYELVKDLVFRMVIADAELGRPVLVAASAYLGKIRRQIAPMVALWRKEAGLEPPATDRRTS